MKKVCSFLANGRSPRQQIYVHTGPGNDKNERRILDSKQSAMNRRGTVIDRSLPRPTMQYDTLHRVDDAIHTIYLGRRYRCATAPSYIAEAFLVETELYGDSTTKETPAKKERDVHMHLTKACCAKRRAVWLNRNESEAFCSLTTGDHAVHGTAVCAGRIRPESWYRNGNGANKTVE